MIFFSKKLCQSHEWISSVNVSYVNSLSVDLPVTSPLLLVQPPRVSDSETDQPAQCTWRELVPFFSSCSTVGLLQGNAVEKIYSKYIATEPMRLKAPT